MVLRQMTRSRLRSSQIAGAGIEPAPPGSKPSIAANSDYPAMKEGRVGLEPTRGCLTSTCSAAELPTQSRVPCGNRTRLSSLEGWHLCRSAKGTCYFQGGSRETRAHNPDSSGHLLSSGVQLPRLQPSSSLIARRPQLLARGTRPICDEQGHAVPHADNRSPRMDNRFHDGPSTRTKKHPAGVEPAPPPWRDGTLPLRHGCVNSWPNC